MDKYEEFDSKIDAITRIMIGFELSDGQRSELQKIAGEIDSAHQDGSLSADERQRLLETMADCGFRLPRSSSERARSPKKKHGTKGRDR